MSVVECQCRRIEVGKSLLARPANPFLNWPNVGSDSKTLVGWGLAQVSNWQAQSHGVLCGGAWSLEFPIH